MTWIQTRRGRAVELDNPKPDDIHAGELALLLARLGRWGNHTLPSYSVAEHSVRVSVLVEHMIHSPAVYGESLSTVNLLLAALLHDGHEGYLGLDATRPLKEFIGEALSPLAEAWDWAIASHFNVPQHLFTHPLVKVADDILLSTERRDVMGPCEREWSWVPPDPLPETIHPRTQECAATWFEQRLHFLLKKRTEIERGDL